MFRWLDLIMAVRYHLMQAIQAEQAILALLVVKLAFLANANYVMKCFQFVLLLFIKGSFQL